MLIFLPEYCETLRIMQRCLFRGFRREPTRSKANRKYSQTKLGYDKYKVMNSCASRVLLNPQRGETTLFITDMTKANVSLPRTIKWDEVTLPEKLVMDKATSSVPHRRNSFSSRIEASRSEYESARRSFLVRTHSITVGLTRSESHNQFPTVNLKGLDTTSSIPRTTYNQEQEDDQKSIQSPSYSSMEPFDVI